MQRIHIIGRKNSGKTTLIEELLRWFTARGYRVGTVKHTHHHHELDVPGKDSHRHRTAGAAAVAILAPNMNAIFWSDAQDAGETDRYARLSAMFVDCHLVLVEGHSGTTGTKIEVWRSATQTQPIAAEDPAVVVVVTDEPNPGVSVPVWSRSDLDGLAKRLIQTLGITPL